MTATADLYKDVFDEDGLIAKVEEDGYFPDGILFAISMRTKLRGLRDSSKRPLFLENMQNAAPYTLNGTQFEFPRNGAFDPTKALMIARDFTQAVYAIRQDATFDVFDSGVISNAEGKVVFNLMQNDMKAIRMVIRLGWDVFNPLNALEADEAQRFPFAVYTPAGQEGTLWSMPILLTTATHISVEPYPLKISPVWPCAETSIWTISPRLA